MDRFWSCVAALALLACINASAAPRDSPPSWDETLTPTPQPDDWLRQLVGRYEFDGLINVVARGDCGFCRRVSGTGDCIAVGTGAGVQCILNVAWEDFYEIVSPNPDDPGAPAGVFQIPGGVSYLNPAMGLFGIDPPRSAISYLLVDNKGLPEGGLGAVKGNRATFRTSCVNTPTLLSTMKPPARGDPALRTCDRIIRIDAKPDSRLVFVTIDIEINEDPFTRYTLSMRRREQTGEDAAAPKAAVSR